MIIIMIIRCVKMWLETKHLNGEGWYLFVYYTKSEWKAFSERLEALGFQRKVTNQGFGRAETRSYYQEPSNYLLELTELNSTASTIDSINKPALLDDRFNIAVFRTVPNKETVVNPYVCFKMDSIPNTENIRRITLTLRAVYTKLMGLSREELDTKPVKVSIEVSE